MNRAYRRQWLRWHSQYENRARIILLKVLKKLALDIPFENMQEDNFEIFTAFYITEESVLKAYNEIYDNIGTVHGGRVGKRINKQINQKDFTFDNFLTEFRNELSAWLLKNRTEGIRSVRANYILYINQIIGKGFTEGSTVAQISTDIKKKINSRNFYKWQALRIARTETTTASNYAATVSAKVSGVKMDKVWVSSQDNRTRRPPDDIYDHYNMNGVKVKLEDNFNVSGQLLMYPGDPKGSAGNIINCRCSVAQVVRRDQDGKIIRDDSMSENINRYNNTEKIVSNYEKDIYKQKYESAGLFDLKGNVILKKDGNATRVRFEKSELSKMKGNILTHNHPLDESFSREDIHVLARHQLKEIRAITIEGRTFSMSLKQGVSFNKIDMKGLKSYITRLENKKIKELSKRYYAKEITLEQYKKMGWDEIWVDFSNSKKYKGIFTYKQL
jgi:hypothetical protein